MERAKLKALIEELSIRAEAQLGSPEMSTAEQVADRISRLGTKYSFLWMLSSMRSALIQPTQLLAFGFPELAGEYGQVKTLAMASKYVLNAAQLFGMSDHSNLVSMRDSGYIKKSPIKKWLLKAYDRGDELESFATTRMGSITQMTGDEESKLRTKSNLNDPSKLNKAGEFVGGGVDLLYRGMTGSIHHLERVSREVYYMSAFELAFNKYKKEGNTEQEAYDIAVREAYDSTVVGMFNFSQVNKPRLAKTWYGRMAWQFRTYQVQALGFILRNGNGTLKYGWDTVKKAAGAEGVSPEVREGYRKASVKFWDMAAMGAVLGGVTGSLGYSAVVAMVDGFRSAIRPDYDDEDAELLYDLEVSGHPAFDRSFDLWVRNVWIPEKFGADSSISKAFGLSPEWGEIMERSATYGLLSGLTNWNFTNSIGLDSLWFRDTPKAASFEEALKNQFITLLGPTGSLLQTFMRGADLIDQGKTYRGIETMMPGMFKEPMEAYRIANEGFITLDDNPIKPADYFTAWLLVGQTLGVTSTEISESQDTAFLIKKQNARRDELKTRMYNSIEQGMLKFLRVKDEHGADSPELAEEKKEFNETVLQKVMEYNHMYFYDPVTTEQIYKSLEGRLKDIFSAYFGVNMKKADAAIFLPILMEASKGLSTLTYPENIPSKN